MPFVFLFSSVFFVFIFSNLLSLSASSLQKAPSTLLSRQRSSPAPRRAGRTRDLSTPPATGPRQSPGPSPGEKALPLLLLLLLLRRKQPTPPSHLLLPRLLSPLPAPPPPFPPPPPCCPSAGSGPPPRKTCGTRPRRPRGGRRCPQSARLAPRGQTVRARRGRSSWFVPRPPASLRTTTSSRRRGASPACR